MAVGCDSGRISVAALAANGLSTSIVYTSPGDPRKTDKVSYGEERHRVNKKEEQRDKVGIEK